MFGKKHLNINFADLNQQKKKKKKCLRRFKDVHKKPSVILTCSRCTMQKT